MVLIFWGGTISESLYVHDSKPLCWALLCAVCVSYFFTAVRTSDEGATLRKWLVKTFYFSTFRALLVDILTFAT